jgi:hypothetical protein
MDEWDVEGKGKEKNGRELETERPEIKKISRRQNF